MDLDYAVYSLIAPMIYLIISKHSAGICVPCDTQMDPKRYIDSQVSMILHGMCIDAPLKPTTGKI